MITNWISDLFEAAALKGIQRALAKLGFAGQPDNAAAYAELDALMGRPAVTDVTPTPAIAAATETATEPSRRRAAR